MRHRVLGVTLLGLAVLAAPPVEAAHQKAAVLATIPTPSRPHIVAVDPIANRVYVSLLFSAGVKVIDGATNTVIADYPVATRPSAVAVNPITRRLYVTHGLTGAPGANTVSVLDADTGALLASVPVGGGPEFVKVNAFTNKVYVAQTFGSNIVVLDGATNAVVRAIPVGGGSHGIAIAFYEAGKFAQAVNLLEAFINQVEAFGKSGVLSPADASRLIGEATKIGDVIRGLG